MHFALYGKYSLKIATHSIVSYIFFKPLTSLCVLCRKKTCFAALSNARVKALEVCRLMGQGLGRPIFITENIIREWKGECATDSNNTSEANVPPLISLPRPCNGELEIQRRIKEENLTVKVDVTATFELNGKFEKLKEKKVGSNIGRRTERSEKCS